MPSADEEGQLILNSQERDTLFPSESAFLIDVRCRYIHDFAVIAELCSSLFHDAQASALRCRLCAAGGITGAPTLAL